MSGSSDVSSSAPFDLIAVGVLLCGPCVLTLVIWGNGRVAVFSRISEFGLLDERGNFFGIFNDWSGFLS